MEEYFFYTVLFIICDGDYLLQEKTHTYQIDSGRTIGIYIICAFSPSVIYK